MYIDHVCEVECAQDTIRVWLRVGNQGYEDVYQNIVVDLYAQTSQGHVLLGSHTIVNPIFAGTIIDAVVLSVPTIDDPILDLIVKVDGGNVIRGALFECDENNNEALWGHAICQQE